MFGPAPFVRSRSVICGQGCGGLLRRHRGGSEDVGAAGLGFFSVGVSEDSVVVVVVDVSGALSLSLLHAAVKPIIARMAAPPTAAEIRRPDDLMPCSVLYWCFLFGESSVGADVRENRVQQVPFRERDLVSETVTQGLYQRIPYDQAYSGNDSVMPLWPCVPS